MLWWRLPILPKPAIKKLLDFILAQHLQIVQDTSKQQGLINIVLLYDI